MRISRVGDEAEEGGGAILEVGEVRGLGGREGPAGEAMEVMLS